MSIRFEHKGAVYSFNRNIDGIGSWSCVRGRPQGMFSSGCLGLIVHANLQHKLSRAAITNGVATKEELATVLKVQKPKRARSGGLKRKSSSLMGEFNPFASNDDQLSTIKDGARVVTVRPTKKEPKGFFDSFFGSDDELTDDITEELEVVEINSEVISRE